jgi:hypothetical protein
MSPVKKLTDIEIDEVSVVDRPANQHGLIAFSKSAGYGDGPINEEDSMPDTDVIYSEAGIEVDPSLLEHGDTVFDAEGNEYVFVEDGAEEVGKALPPVLNKFGEGLKAGVGGWKQGAKGGRAGAVGEHLGRNRWRYGAGAGAAGAAGLGGAAMSKSAGDTVLEALSKAVTDEDRDAIISKALSDVEVYKSQTEELAKALEAEQDLRITEEFISKAAEYNLPVSPIVLGPILKAVAEVLDDEQLDVLDAIFEAVGDALYNEVGYVGDTDNVSVLNQVDAMADELVGKADVSKAEAMVAMFTANPQAYEAYLAEQNGR